MASRGRKSAAESAVVVIEGGFGGKRHEPPNELTEPQRAIWRETVASEPADFFSTAATRALLKDYCRHRAEAERISLIINSFQADWLKSEQGIKRYDALSKVRERETRGAANMARQLRLTNQARYRPDTAQRAGDNALKGKLPWEFDGENEE